MTITVKITSGKDPKRAHWLNFCVEENDYIEIVHYKKNSNTKEKEVFEIKENNVHNVHKTRQSVK